MFGRVTAYYTATLGFIILALIMNSAVAAEPSAERIVARVGASPITAADFATAYEQARRNRFYHGAPQPDQQRAFQREVAEDLIFRTLLLQEANRRGITPDRKQVDARLARYEQQYAQNPDWPQNRERVLAFVRNRVEENSTLQQLEARVRAVPAPTEQQLRQYYRANPEKFTEPERWRVSLILLPVDPSAPSASWENTRAKAREVIQELQAGADFATMASRYSGDISATRGGDMGYLHEGMLAKQAEIAIKALQAGGVTKPITVLEGIAIFRLDEYQPAQQHSFEAARERVQQLWLQEQGEHAWQALRARLRKATPIEIYDPQLLPLDPA